MVIYGTLEVVLKASTEPSQGVKSHRMAKKEDVSNVADFFEINTLHHWCTTPCVIKTQWYDYIWDSGGSVETPYAKITGCEKSQNGYKEGVPLLATSFEIDILSITLHYWCTSPCIIKTQRYDCVVLCWTLPRNPPGCVKNENCQVLRFFSLVWCSPSSSYINNLFPLISFR